MGYNNNNNTCVLCHSLTERFVRVCIQDNLQLLKQTKEFTNLNPYSFLLMCSDCVMKLRIFIKCDSNIYIPNNNQTMQESSNSKVHFEDTSCQCDHCKAKYGNLPLLAEVIEKIENKAKAEIITISDEEQTNIYLNDCVKKKTKTENEDISQPSTSRETNTKKTFCCEHCDKKFTHKGDFNKHLRKHTGEQPFQCTVCNRKFAHTSNLARHLRVHSGHKPFHCERCNKSFSRKDKLIMHQKTRLCLNSKVSD